jgi:hypothetical protein
MTGDNYPGIVNKHRVRKAEALDALRDLPDLLARVRTGITGI